MNTNHTLERVRDLVESKIMELQPFSGEEMSLPNSDPHRAGFLEGERALALEIFALLQGKSEAVTEPMEEDMVLSLGRT